MATFQQVPSNYTQLPAVTRTALPADDGATFDRPLPDRVNGRLDLVLTTLDPLHIGSGGGGIAATQQGDALAHGIIAHERSKEHPDGMPVIPGASIKGVLRSHLEAMLGGCDMEPQPCGACPTCSLLGFIAGDRQQMGRLGVADGRLLRQADADNIGLLLVPRPYGPRRQTGRRVYGPRVDVRNQVPYIVVLQGVTFQTSLALVNVRREELGAALLALGADGSFCPRLGGGKFAGLGRVRTRVERAVLRGDYRRPSLRRLSGPELTAEVGSWIESAGLSSEGWRALDTLRKVMRP